MKRERSRHGLVVFLVALPCVVLLSCLGSGAIVVGYYTIGEIAHPSADVDSLLAGIDSGEIALGADFFAAFRAGGHGCQTWGPFQSGGHEFIASRFHEGSRTITIFAMDEKIIAAQGSGLLGRGRFGDTWFFIDLDKFNAYIDANTGGRAVRSGPVHEPGGSGD